MYSRSAELVHYREVTDQDDQALNMLETLVASIGVTGATLAPWKEYFAACKLLEQLGRPQP